MRWAFSWRSACGPALALVLSCAAAPPARAQEVDLVTQGSPCLIRENTAGAGLGTTWTLETFDDSTWTPGTYGVGYETGTGTVATGLLQSTVATTSASVYTRALFNVPSAAAATSLVLGCDFDDGIVAWINGVEVYRSPQMPAGAPGWNTQAALHESSNRTAPLHEPFHDISAVALPALHDGANLLAIGAWNAALPSSDLVLCPRLILNRPLQVDRGPYLQVGTPTSVIVRWRTSLECVGRVLVGPSPGSLSTAFDEAAPTTEHEVLVTGLSPATRTCYSVGTATQVLAGDDDATCFVTPPPVRTRAPLRAWVLGDSGTGGADAARVRDAFVAFNAGPRPDFWLLLGDNAYESGLDGEYERGIFDMYPDTLRSAVLWPTIGNHDSISADSATQTGPYYDAFTMPTAGEAGGVASGTESYYSFDWANIHFVCLDSDDLDRSPAGAMATWLVQDLAATTQDWTIAYWHHPPYTKGTHDSDTEIRDVEMRESIVPILEQAGVDLVLCGHSHVYERTFLLDGHLDVSTTLTPAMILDGGDGRIGGDGAYHKPAPGPIPHSGEVHVVAGTSGKLGSGPLDHPAMFTNVVEFGSLILDVDGLRLDVTFLDDQAAIRDSFTMLKDCSALDPGLRTPPIEVNQLLVAKPAPGSTDALLSWTDPSPAGGGSVRSDVATGLLSALHADRGFAGASCLAPDLTAPTTTDARLTRRESDGYWYLPRARNACGPSPWGAPLAVSCP